MLTPYLFEATNSTQLSAGLARQRKNFFDVTQVVLFPERGERIRGGLEGVRYP